MTPVSRRRESGETLVELLIAVSIMGIAMAAIVGGVFTAVKVSDQNRAQAATVTVLRGYAETLKAADGPYEYVPCASTSTYPAFAPPPPDQAFTATVTDVRYLSDATALTPSWSSTCPGTDQGAQLLSLRVTAPGGAAVEEVEIVKRDARCDAGSSPGC
jgi:type II secretory pathway pseudopilin PulG